VAKLIADPERLWAEWKHGRPLTQKQLGGLLRPGDRVSGRRLKGLRWQTHLRGDIERKRLFAPVANRPRSITGILVTCLRWGRRSAWWRVCWATASGCENQFRSTPPGSALGIPTYSPGHLTFAAPLV
jgi:hypothetical protein